MVVLYVNPRFRYNHDCILHTEKWENRIENLTFARYVPTPENRSALLAVRDVVTRLRTGVCRRAISPLYLHGPAGTGNVTSFAPWQQDHGK